MIEYKNLHMDYLHSFASFEVYIFNNYLLARNEREREGLNKIATKQILRILIFEKRTY